MFPNTEMVKALAQDHLQTLHGQAETRRLLKTPQAPSLGQKLSRLLRKLAEWLEGKPLSPTKPI